MKIICSHGFGVGADARGMFTEVAASLPEHEFVMFDYNDFDENGNATVYSLEQQAEKLQLVIDHNPDVDTLLCHSQGSLIAGMVNLRSIGKVILLAPPARMSMQHVIDKLMKKPGSEIDLESISRLPRSDGTTTFITKDYIQSLDGVDPVNLYSKVATSAHTLIVRASNDDVLGHTDFNQVDNARVIDINADHDFTGTARNDLKLTLRSILSS